MRTRILTIAALCLLGPASANAACENDTIEAVSGNGDLIILSSGESYDVVGGDKATAATWRGGESVIVCDGTMVNRDENGERVEVRPH